MPELISLFDTEVLGLTIYGEARGEPVEGQIAVGCVIRNRVVEKGSDYKRVCFEPLQFSCWNEDDPNRLELIKFADLMLNHLPMTDAMVRQCLWLSFGIANGAILDNTNGAKNYLTTKLYNEKTTNWARALKVSVVKGNQTFLV